MIKNSVVSYKKRGMFGDNAYRGNTTGLLIMDLIKEFRLEGIEINKVLDPMEGSGTTRDVCEYMHIDYTGLDLKDGFNLMTDELPDKTYDMVFIHPPYWNMIVYSDDENDLSNCRTYEKFIENLSHCLMRCFMKLKKGGVLVLLIGDMRKKGKYYFMASDIEQEFGKKWNIDLRNIIIKIQHNTTSAGYFYGNKFIRINHEFVLVWRK